MEQLEFGKFLIYKSYFMPYSSKIKAIQLLWDWYTKKMRRIIRFIDNFVERLYHFLTNYVCETRQSYIASFLQFQNICRALLWRTIQVLYSMVKYCIAFTFIPSFVLSLHYMYLEGKLHYVTFLPNSWW